jgi:putative endonuclease
MLQSIGGDNGQPRAHSHSERSEESTIPKEGSNVNQYYVYILASANRRTYVGVTNDLQIRLWQHQTPDSGGSKFAANYHINKLVHYEIFSDPYTAISREKEIKAWRREKKVALIEKQNPDWLDLGPGLHISVPLPG